MAEIIQQSPPRRSAARRWIARLFVGVLTLLIVGIAVVQIALNTAIPRAIVLAQVQKVLGLHVTAESISTGWFGHTTLRNVTVSLPLAEHAFLEIPELRVTHTILPVLLATQSVDIHALWVDQPRMNVTQGPDGRWNLQDLAQILLKIGGNSQSQPQQKSEPIVLPRLTIKDGQIDVKDKSGRLTSITPLDVNGEPVNALVWQYNAVCDTAAGAHIKFAGRVAPNDNFSHEMDFKLSDLASIAKPWIANFDRAAIVEGSWRGAQTTDGVSGRLLLKTLKYGMISAEQGDVGIAATGSSVTATPSRLLIRADATPLESFLITGGSLSLDSAAAKAIALQVSALNGRLLVDGTFTLADQSGNLHAEWKTLEPAPTFTSSGTLDASLRTNWPDQRSVKVDISAIGTAWTKGYNAQFNIAGGGKTWDDASINFTAPTLNWSGNPSASLDHLIAQIQTLPGQINLTQLTLPNSSTVTGSGGLRFDPQHPSISDYSWWLFLQGQNWTLPNTSGAELAFGVNAWGDPQQIRLQQAYGIVGKICGGAEGYYRFEKPKPVDLSFNICELPEAAGNTADMIQGRVRGEGVLVGTAFPMSFDANGQLHGEQVVFDGRPPQRIDVKCTAALHNNLFSFHTEELSLLGGEWSLNGQIPAKDAAHGNAPDVTLRFHDLPLQNVGDLFHQPDVAGIAAGTLEADIDQFATDQVTASGHFQLTNVRASQFKADSIATDVSLKDGLLELSPIDLRLGGGMAHATVSTKLNNPRLLTASLHASNWPVDAAPIHALVSASSEEVSIDAKTQTATGQLQFDASAKLQDRPLLTADGTIAVDGRVLNLQKLTVKILDGDASGWASMDIDHPLTSRGTLRWDALNLGKLAGYDTLYQTATGFLTGRADLAPTNDPRALGPLMLDIASVGQATRFKSVALTQLHLPIFFDTDRVVVSGGKVDIAGGTVGLFARASLHTQNALSTLIQTNLTDLDIEQLFHAADKTEADKIKSYPGRLSGQVSLLGDPRDQSQLFATASLRIHDSDLGSFGPFAVLYDTMHLGGTWGKKIGEGTVEARYDNGSLIISSLRYFNRGVDAYGLVTIRDVRKYPICPLSGELVGTYSPLKNIKLPFFADADKIFSVLQTNLTSIVIGGTFPGQATYLPESAAAIGNAMRNFLLGNVTEPK